MSGLDRVESRAERSTDRRQVPHEPHHSPWLNTADAAVYLRYTGKHPRLSVYKFMKRHGIVARHDGRRVLIARADIERALAHGGRKTAAATSTSSTPLKGVRS